jgi:hypothetical protein
MGFNVIQRCTIQSSFSGVCEKPRRRFFYASSVRFQERDAVQSLLTVSVDAIRKGWTRSEKLIKYTGKGSKEISEQPAGRAFGARCVHRLRPPSRGLVITPILPAAHA